MKILICHHVQERWDENMRRFTNTNFEEMCEKIIAHVDSENSRGEPYDRIILSNFEGEEIEQSQYFNLVHHLPAYYFIAHQFDYGWTFDDLESGTDLKDYIKGGKHSPMIYKYEWIEDEICDRLAEEVYLCGAFINECLEDIEILLRYHDVPYHRVEDLIV